MKAEFYVSNVGRYPIIMIIRSKMAHLELKESSEVEGFRKPKWAQTEAELCVSDVLGGSFWYKKRRSCRFY